MPFQWDHTHYIPDNILYRRQRTADLIGWALVLVSLIGLLEAFQ